MGPQTAAPGESTGVAASGERPNILFITLDQFRADCLSCASHPVVRTPALDHLAANGVRLARHYSQAAPCAPGRAALYTGMYQMNNRVVWNGTPLDSRFDNIAYAARRAGYAPALFGYTDQGVDPRNVEDPNDPRLSTYEGVLPGFDAVLDLSDWQRVWFEWLRELGYDEPDPITALSHEDQRPVEVSNSAFTTDRFLSWHAEQDQPWFAHLSYLRPHSPYSAAGHFATMYDPADCPPALPIPERPHPLLELLYRTSAASPRDPKEIAVMRAQYYGMISEVDAQLSRLWAALAERGQWENTVIVVTSDHGEQLGDQGLKEKCGFYEPSYAIVGIVRDPRCHHVGVVDDFTENVDIMPTLCEAMGIDVPLQCDGLPLTPFLNGQTPPAWRDAAHYEFDWRAAFIPHGDHPWPWDRRLERQNLAVRRSRDHAFVHFGDGSWLCFDLAADPTWQTELSDRDAVLAEATAMLTWRSRHLDRTMTGMLLQDGGVGRRPDPLPAGR